MFSSDMQKHEVETSKRKVTFADSPGMRDYIKTMISQVSIVGKICSYYSNHEV
jgi:translation elongation factor EF-Tu-like GTPase